MLVRWRRPAANQITRHFRALDAPRTCKSCATPVPYPEQAQVDLDQSGDLPRRDAIEISRRLRRRSPTAARTTRTKR